MSPPQQPTASRHAVVVGSGIAGLAAAHRLARTAPAGTRVTLLEGSPVLGGKLRVTPVGDVPVDEGAEALLARVPEALELARAVGLGDDLVHPATTKAAVWTRGRLRPIPAGTVMGVPGDLAALDRSGVLSPAGLLRLPLDVVLPRTRFDDDVAVGWYVARRLGREVVDRLVDPMLGGVYAGRADELSLTATVPALAAQVRRHRCLLAAARAAMPARSGAVGPVFASVRGGLGRLAEAVAADVRAAGVDVRTSAMVRRLQAGADGRWRLTLGPTRSAESMTADAVVLAVPASPAAKLLAEVAPAAAVDLGAVDYASMALVTLVFRAGTLPPLTGSGFLVPAVDGRLIKAATFLTRKWPWLAEAASGLEIVRCSVGRHGEEADVQRDDDDLVRGCRDDLAAAVGGSGELVASRVTRWGGGLPQYAVAHRARVARIEAALAGHPGLAVCGAAYEGIGIPACIRSAHGAVRRVLPALAGDAPWGRMET